MTAQRLCEPGCPDPGEPHREPEPDWIGDEPLLHGESERPVPGTGGFNGFYTVIPDAYCLCGHPNYVTCPKWLTDGIASWTIETDTGRQA